MTNLLNFNQAQLAAYFLSIGEKPFRAKQLMRWMHHFGVVEVDAMTDIAKTLREKLKLEAEITPPSVQLDLVSDDGTRKWLIDTGNSNAIETVFIPEDDRGTLCVSSQVGCALECTFCSTGRQGFNRNLSVAEIIGQVWVANKSLRAAPGYDMLPANERIISNVVMMGMGEPLANYDNVVTAMQIMLDDSAYGLSRRRVTLSTSGLVPAMDRLKEDCPVALAVSLHAPNDALRDIIVPINKKYPIKELMAACNRYLERAPRDFVLFRNIFFLDSHCQARREFLHFRYFFQPLVSHFFAYQRTQPAAAIKAINIYSCVASIATSSVVTILMCFKLRFVLSITLPANCPHAASISSPRVLRTVTI